jgi:hypothetical protein
MVVTTKTSSVQPPAEVTEAGRYRAVIDRRYALEDVIEAHPHPKPGNVVLTLDGAR